jgi:hypothetical protein
MRRHPHRERREVGSRPGVHSLTLVVRMPGRTDTTLIDLNGSGTQ